LKNAHLIRAPMSLVRSCSLLHYITLSRTRVTVLAIDLVLVIVVTRYCCHSLLPLRPLAVTVTPARSHRSALSLWCLLTVSLARHCRVAKGWRKVWLKMKFRVLCSIMGFWAWSNHLLFYIKYKI